MVALMIFNINESFFYTYVYTYVQKIVREKSREREREREGERKKKKLCFYIRTASFCFFFVENVLRNTLLLIY